MVEKRDVSEIDSFKYLRSQLNIGGKALSNYINMLPIESGKVFSFVPKGTSEKSLYEFEKGGLYFFDKELLKQVPPLVPIQNEARPLLISTVYNYLNSGMENCCIFEEPIALPSDPWVKNSMIKYVHINNEMFYFFDNKNKDIKEIDRAFKASEAHYFLCALSSFNTFEHDKFISFKEITIELIKEVVDNLNSFFVRAYDGEGYLMWTKQLE